MPCEVIKLNKNYDLIIVGAGPSGVFTAYELIELGIAKDKKILLVEQGKAVDKKDAKIYKEEANTVVFAIGLKPDKNLIQDQGIELDDWGYIKINEKGRTNLENVYAGGDNTESKATVCRALAAGKRAAKGIIENLLNND